MPINTLRTIPEVNTSSVECISDSSSEREYMTDGSEDTGYSDGSNSTKLSETSDTMNETTSSDYDGSQQSVSKDKDTYTFLPPPEYRNVDSKQRSNPQKRLPQTAIKRKPLTPITVSTGGIPAAQQPPDYSSSPFVFHSSPLSADARTLSSFKHYSPSKEFGSNQGEEAPEYFADRGVSSTSRKTVSPDIPSPIANTIDELTRAEKRQYEQSILTTSEQQEYHRLELEYRDNEEIIRTLRSTVNDLFFQYSDMKKQQIEDLHRIEHRDHNSLQNLSVPELTQTRKEFCEQFEKRQRDILSQIDDKYEKPVTKMYNDTLAIVMNMSRSLLGRILFAVVWLMEFIWNWIKREWSHLPSMKTTASEVQVEHMSGSKKRTKKRK
ncbi:hypothetical protein WA588_006021, partial [Blastocystis sp. NMH]